MRILAPLALATALLTAPAMAPAFDLSQMTEAERAAFRAEVRAYLLDNPEIIIEAVNLLEERQRNQQADQDKTLVEMNANAIFDDGMSWVGGNPEGDITLVEFLDYRCGYCRKAHAEVTELVATDGNIRYIIKEFPILGPDSTASSHFAIAVRRVAGDEAYKSAHDALMAMKTEAGETALRRLAESLGIDADLVLAEMHSEEVSRQIAQTALLAQRLGITGTPTFVMQREMLRGYLPLDAMRHIAEQIRSEG